jgi:hypothetical protein
MMCAIVWIEPLELTVYAVAGERAVRRLGIGVEGYCDILRLAMRTRMQK